MKISYAPLMTVLLIGILVGLGNRDAYDGTEQPACSDPGVAVSDIFSVTFSSLCCHFNFRIGFSSII